MREEKGNTSFGIRIRVNAVVSNMEFVADPAKVLAAYRITNQQFAEANQKLRRELYEYEQRYNSTNELWLAERQENKALRDMVRKLKDQMQMITKVMVSVQDQSETLFERINRPHQLAEDMMRNYTPRAPHVYQRRRTEFPPCVDEAAVPEGDEEEREESEADVAKPEEEAEQDEAADEDIRANGSDRTNPNTPDRMLNRGNRSVGELLPAHSPLVQRLKRPSKNASFDESFETIDRDRVFKLSRRSHNRREIYSNLQQNEDELQSIYDASNREIDEVLRETLRRMSSPVRMDESDHEEEEQQQEVSRQSSSSDTSPGSEPPPTRSKPKDAMYHSRLKKTVSESMLLRMQRASVGLETDITDDRSSASREETEMTVFNPAELVASCSTPVVQRDVAEPERRHGRGRPPKTKSETELSKQTLHPVVLVQPLTVKNVQHHEQSTQPKRRGRPPKAAAAPAATMRQQLDSSNSFEGTTTLPDDGCTLDAGSSMENLSQFSGESYRPRRRTAPKTLREPSLRIKLRRC
uniref:Shugoshin C-terminal domain-containing protein n=1 Tax=Anopheles dirus TaxID=7168 RepID=A0A182N941_9DIPT